VAAGDSGEDRVVLGSMRRRRINKWNMSQAHAAIK